MKLVPSEYIKWLGLWLCLLLDPAQAESPALSHDLTPIKAPGPAPGLRLPNLAGETVDIRSLEGKVVVVNFWATWCPPCIREMPSMEQLYLMTGDRGVVVLAVNIGEDLETISPFLDSLTPRPSFPVLIDSDASSLSAWKVRGLPTTQVVDPDGQLAFEALGGREFSHPKLIEQLMDLLDESTTP